MDASIFVAMSFKRITVDPRVMGGVQCIRDLRIPVAVVAGMHAEGMSALQILQAFPDLADEDIQAALRFQVADAGEDDA